MTKRSDIIDEIQGQHKRLLVEQYNADPCVVDRQFANIENDIRKKRGGSANYVMQMPDVNRADRDAAIRDLRRRGISVKSIAARYDLSEQSIYVITRQNTEQSPP